MTDADVIVVGAGLAAAAELADAGRKVLLLDQEGPQSLGGQAFWSFGGLFLVDRPRTAAGRQAAPPPRQPPARAAGSCRV